MRHLILGGTGAVESLVVWGLLDKGETVREADRGSTVYFLY
jgi:nucleoside-diphosphate-sugar epimerase